MASGKKKKASLSSSKIAHNTAGGKGDGKKSNNEHNISETNDGAIQLPRKEGDLFNDALIGYENRKFKDALHSIEKILKKFPNHGETLCMKGLITRHCELKPNEKDEERKKKAHEFVSVGVKNNIFSHVCWHVYGLLHKAERNYKEASKCYSQALKIDPNNFLVVRDLAQAHLMLREMDEYVDARRKLFELKMGQPGSSDRANQIVIGLYMSEKWEECLEMLNEFEKFDKMDQTRRNGELLAKKKEIPEPTYEDTFQESEILLFRAVVLEKMGKVDECVELLENNEKKIVDDAARLTQLCRLKIAKGDATAARKIAENDLVNRMPDNEKYHELMHESMNTKVSLMKPPMKRSEEDIAKLKTLYDALQKKHAKSSVCKRYPLQIVNDSSEFESLLAEYIQKPLRKGVPSLFADISSLYGGIHDEEKSIGKVLKAAADSLKKSGKFPSSSDNKDDAEAKPKETHRYALNLLAMHYAKIGKIDEELKCIDEAIEAKDDNDGEQEKVLEFHLNKSRFLKRAGDLEGAYEESEIARNMDLADRYINSVSVKRAFQCGKFREAERLGTLFTRDAENYRTNLFDMQCNWYAYEAGHSHEKFEKNVGRALKYYREIRTHCEQIIEDQIDFHRYCVNVKRTLRSFMDTLKMCDDIYASAWFKKAARRAILICVDMHDDSLEAKKERVEAKLSKLDQEERKKERQKTRKEEEKKEKEVESFEKLLADDLKRARETKAKRTGKPVSENSSNTTTTNKDSSNNNSAIEKEYLEEKYGAKAFAQASKDPMEEALSFMNPLLMSVKNDEDVNVQSLVFLVHFKRQKWVLATKALRKMAKCAQKNPLTHRCVDSLSRAIASIENEIEKQVVQSTISSLNDPGSELCVDKVNVQCKTLVDAAHLSIMKNNFEKALLGAVDPRKTSWKECRDALEVFERSGNATFYEQFHKACTSAFPSKSNKSKEHPSVISAAFARVGVEDSARSAPFL